MGSTLIVFQFCNSFLEQTPIDSTNLGLHPFPAQDTVSVHRPGFYAHRFLDFCADRVFKKIPSRECCRLQFRFPFVYVVSPSLISSCRTNGLFQSHCIQLLTAYRAIQCGAFCDDDDHS